MRKHKKTVMGVYAPSAGPDWRGFLILGIILGGPLILIVWIIGLLLG